MHLFSTLSKHTYISFILFSLTPLTKPTHLSPMTSIPISFISSGVNEARLRWRNRMRKKRERKEREERKRREHANLLTVLYPWRERVSVYAAAFSSERPQADKSEHTDIDITSASLSETTLQKDPLTFLQKEKTLILPSLFSSLIHYFKIKRNQDLSLYFLKVVNQQHSNLYWKICHLMPNISIIDIMLIC